MKRGAQEDIGPIALPKKKARTVDENSPDQGLSPAPIQKQFDSALDGPFITILFPKLDYPDLVTFSRACKQTQEWSMLEIERRAASRLLEAVVLGNQAEAERIIKCNPKLLISTQGKATDHTDKTFTGLSPFQAALCGWDDDMAAMMKPYFAQIENGQVEMENQSKEIFPNGIEAHVKAQEDAAFDFSEIINEILNAPENEVQAALNKQFDTNLALHQALESFRSKFDEISCHELVFNPQHFYRAIQQYIEAFDKTDSWDKRDLIWRQVFGYTQRHFSACYGQAVAQGIYYLVEEKEALRRSFNFRFGGGALFPLGGLAGAGYDFAASGRGRIRALRLLGLPLAHTGRFLFLCRAKAAGLEKLFQWYRGPVLDV